MRPTDIQLEAAKELDLDSLIDTALWSLFALNRRVKEKRDRRNKYRRATFSEAITAEVKDIYRLKDLFLSALVASGRAKLQGFTLKKMYTTHVCPNCGNSWGPTGDTCFECGSPGQLYNEVQEDHWYLVSTDSASGNGYSFHVPGDSLSFTEMEAEEIEPHDPFQMAKAIPKDRKLTIGAQIAIVKLATDRLITTATALHKEEAVRLEG